MKTEWKRFTRETTVEPFSHPRSITDARTRDALPHLLGQRTRRLQPSLFSRASKNRSRMREKKERKRRWRVARLFAPSGKVGRVNTRQEISPGDMKRNRNNKRPGREGE